MLSYTLSHPGCGLMIAIRNVLRNFKGIVVLGNGCVVDATVDPPKTSWEVPAVLSKSLDPVTVGESVKEETGEDVVVILEMDELKRIPKKDIMVLVYDKNGWVGSNNFLLRFYNRDIYLASASISHLKDLDEKLKKSRGKPSVIQILTPCPPEWKINPRYTVKISRIAVESLVFPLYEIEDGKVRITYEVSNPRSLFEYTKLQGRFFDLNDEYVRSLERDFREFYKFLLSISKI